MYETKGQDPTPQDLEAEFDPRLAEVWLAAFSCGMDLDEVGPKLGVLLRMAYLQGYHDSLTEDVRGQMFTRLGIAVPPRTRAVTRKGGSR